MKFRAAAGPRNSPFPHPPANWYNTGMASLDSEAHQIASLLAASRHVVVFTGAGISTESGIPDFRSPGGVWSRYKPVMYQEFLRDHDARKRYWIYKREFYENMAASRPNAGHRAVAELEALGKLWFLITQNIDGLHQDAGNSAEKIIELHGTNRWIECVTCARRYAAEDMMPQIQSEDVPQCECGGWLKPATISFGQSMPVRETSAAQQASCTCDAFLVVGSSLQVHPAASMPLMARESGAKLAIVNLEPTPLDRMAHVVWREKAGAALTAIVSELRKQIAGAN